MTPAEYAYTFALLVQQSLIACMFFMWRRDVRNSETAYRKLYDIAKKESLAREAELRKLADDVREAQNGVLGKIRVGDGGDLNVRVTHFTPSPYDEHNACHPSCVKPPNTGIPLPDFGHTTCESTDGKVISTGKVMTTTGCAVPCFTKQGEL